MKETLNARSHYGSIDDDGGAVHRINQYIIKQEIGRGSFGAVHLAVDQFGQEYAVKEFSKSRLRKRAQSNLLRNPNAPRRPGSLVAGGGFNSPLHRLSSSDKMKQDNNSLSLIKEEIAVMKKLNHNNLVSLIEVLDDPQEDSLYMVLELCKKGVVMKVGLDERAEPYEDEACRCWFRDMILGIEYLHAQGIIHRDIKPDNCLITEDDVLKIVDFGVSEMFEKTEDMKNMATAKSAGSPAFMPPELCIAKHGQVSGRAVDIWSMGVTLYCLRYGHIPFEKGGMLELYESIREDDVPLDEEQDERFRDLMKRILEKDPDKRITMQELREHPWVTNDGADPLLSAEDNCSDIVEPPTEAEMDHAITGNMANLLVVMKAVKRFKDLIHSKRRGTFQGLMDRTSRLFAPPSSAHESGSRSMDAHDRRPLDKVLMTDGVHRDIEVNDDGEKVPKNIDHVRCETPRITICGVDESKPLQTPQRIGPRESEALEKQREEANSHKPRHESHPADHRDTMKTHEHGGDDSSRGSSQSRNFNIDDTAKGHAHDPLSDNVLLNIGADPEKMSGCVSESPAEVEMNIYEQAYQKEMKRILERRGKGASMFLTRRVEHREDLKRHDNVMVDAQEAAGNAAGRLSGLLGHRGGGVGGLASLIKDAATKQRQDDSGHDRDEVAEKAGVDAEAHRNVEGGAPA